MVAGPRTVAPARRHGIERGDITHADDLLARLRGGQDQEIDRLFPAHVAVTALGYVPESGEPVV